MMRTLHFLLQTNLDHQNRASKLTYILRNRILQSPAELFSKSGFVAVYLLSFILQDRARYKLIFYIQIIFPDNPPTFSTAVEKTNRSYFLPSLPYRIQSRSISNSQTNLTTIEFIPRNYKEDKSDEP